VAGTVVCQVVVEFIGDRGELLQQVVGVLFPAGATWLRIHILDALHARVQKFDEQQDGLGGYVAGLPHLLNFFVGERTGARLRRQWCGTTGDGQQCRGAGLYAHGLNG
jgi:hypothetical protein